MPYTRFRFRLDFVKKWVSLKTKSFPVCSQLIAGTFLADRIARVKTPRQARIVELSMTISGKPQKFIMRDKPVEMLSAKSAEAIEDQTASYEE